MKHLLANVLNAVDLWFDEFDAEVARAKRVHSLESKYRSPPLSDPFFHPISGFELPHFAGVPTFMRLPHVRSKYEVFGEGA